MLKRKILVEWVGTAYFGNISSELPIPLPTSQAAGELSCSIVMEYVQICTLSSFDMVAINSLSLSKKPA